MDLDSYCVESWMYGLGLLLCRELDVWTWTLIVWRAGCVD